MGKRYFFLYDKVIHLLNIWTAYKNAARGKRYKTAKGGIHAKQLQAAWNDDYLLKVLASGI